MYHFLNSRDEDWKVVVEKGMTKLGLFHYRLIHYL